MSGFRFTALATLVSVLTLSPMAIPLGAEDSESLQAAHAAVVRAKSNADSETLSALSHPDAVIFLRGAAFPFDSKGMPRELVRSGWQHGFDFVESVAFSVIDPIYRVVGDTGVVTAHERMIVKPKDGPLLTRYNRVTTAYSWQGDRWLLVSHHASAIPSQDP